VLSARVLFALSPPTRDGARGEAHRELSRNVYDAARPSLLVRGLKAALDAVGNLLDKAASATPGGAVGLLALVALLAVVVVVVVRLGPLKRPQTTSGHLDVPAAISAAQLRSEAEAYATERRWAEAVRARLRAVVRLLEDRTLIEPRPGRTAAEVARDAGAVAPPLGAPLTAATTVFSEIWYGHREAGAEDYRLVADLDEAVQRYRLGAAVSAPGARGPAVPA
jgi:hypothetical protein